MKSKTLLIMALAALLLAPVQAQEKKDKEGKPPAEEPVHDELRALKDELVEAINKNDIDRLLSKLDKDVVVTWMNAEVSRGPAEVRAYLERMTKGPKPIVKSYKTEPVVEELTHMYGDDCGVSYGHSKDTFLLTDGREFTVTSRWSATTVKKDGKWLVANFHGSANVFDNAVLDIAIRTTARWTGIAAGAAGLLVGGGLVWFLRRRTA